MQEILDNFLTITKIPHCSFHADKMELFLKEFAKEHGYGVKVDKAKNILVYAKEPKICLQAHYDMVCVGKAPDIEVVQEDNILRAKESSLGADNGIAIAMMMQLIKEGAQLEFLFTSDEEVGLIGAKNLELPIKSKYLLNLDSEDEAEVYIGCAGGVDLKLTKELTPIEQKGYCYEVSIKNLPGGHSGVDIDKGIPNAITNLAAFIKKHNAKVALFSGGERINSIPANASAAIVSEKKLQATDGVELKELAQLQASNFSVDELLELPNGVLKVNEEFNVVQTSANLALVTLDSNSVTIELSLRSLDTQELMDLAMSIKKRYEAKGYRVALNDKYPGWKPEINEFTKKVQEATKEIFGTCETKVIHAGLECGLLGQKLPGVKMASIGPNIRFPHSKREYVELDSVARVYRVVQRVIQL